jgi:ATP-binding cassette subfamily B protein
MWRVARPFRRNLVISGIFCVLKHIPVYVLPIVTADVINTATRHNEGGLHRILVDVAILLIAVLLNFPNTYIHLGQLSRSMRGIERELRGAMARRLQQLSVSFLHTNATGKLLTKLVRDVDILLGFYNRTFSTAIESTLSVCVGIGTAIYKGRPEILIFYVVMIPIVVFLIQGFRRPLERANREFRENFERASSRLGIMLNMMPVTRAHAVENEELDQVESRLEGVFHAGVNADRVTSIFGTLHWVSLEITIVLCLALCSWLALENKIPPGDIALYTSFFVVIQNSARNLLGSWMVAMQGKEALRSLAEVLECPDIELNEGRAPVAKVTGSFQFDNLSFCYPGRTEPALDKINLTVPSGETIAFVGESGSGKSTAVSLIIGFRRPTSGRLLLDGRNMEELDLRQYRRFLAVVPQETLLFSGTIRENILYGLPFASEKELLRVAEAARVMEFAADLPNGLDTPLGESGAMLSGGQRQRVAIARALIRDPRVIVLDEATSALDTASEQAVQEALAELTRGRTTFVVAHRLSTIRNANRIVVLHEGRIVETGTWAELSALNGHFAHLKGRF